MNFVKAAFAAVLFAAAAPSLAVAEQAQLPMPAVQGTLLSVSAQGKVDGKPDMAVISLGVMTEAPTAVAALSDNATRMNALMAALRRAGIADRDIQTSNISLNPQYQYQDNQPPHLTGYQANNQVSVKVRDITRLGRAIDATVQAGGNTVNGVSFTFQNPDVPMDAARADAITQARHRADLYAQALNLHVFRVISVSEGGGYSPPVPMPVFAMSARAEAAPTPVSAGEVQTTAEVNVLFELR